MNSGKFDFLRNSVELDRPKTTVHIDRDRSGDLGVNMREIGRSFSTLLGDGYVNRFSLAERSKTPLP